MADGSVPKMRIAQPGTPRLVCIPYAGGSTAPFYRWKKQIPEWLDVVPLSLPGHDGRLHEPPCTSLRALAAELAVDIEAAFNEPYVLLGHSMGAWLAYELAREARRRGARLPELLVVAAARAAHLPLDGSPVHMLPDEELLHAVDQRYGGIPAAVRESPELLRLVLPSLRADLQMVETYRYTEEPPLEVEIFALGGSDDPAVSVAQLDGWRRHTTRGFSLRLLPGGHFFLFSNDGRVPSLSAPHSQQPSAGLQAIVSRIQLRTPGATR
jgi:medium-chain acyl-[acyl-carrier-protein] hydrolase